MLSKVRFHARHGLIIPAITAAVLLFAFPGVAGASHSSGGGPPMDFAVGSGTQGVVKFRFHARSDPLGLNPSGTMFVESTGIPPFSIEAEVTCLATEAIVGGTQATLIGNRTGGTGLPLATGLLFAVIDNGPTVPDHFSFAVSPPTSPCLPFGSSAPIDRGQITVHDG